MILAAGLGRRLKPLTNDKPKALVEVGGKPMIQWVLEKLEKEGFNEIIVNVHHFADQLIEFLNNYKSANLKIEISDESNFLLDTGGALLKAADFLKGTEPFLIHNVDILSTIDLQKFYNYHLENGALATLAVKKRKSFKYLLFNKNNELAGFHNEKTGESIFSTNSPSFLTKYGFSGIHVISPEIFDLIIEKGKFSITNLYLRLARKNKILAYIHNDDYWFDLGKRDQIIKAEDFIESGMMET